MKYLKMVLVAAAGMNLAACATASSPVSGAWYMDVKGPVAVTSAYGGTAEGKACASSLLGLIATGDASVEAAKKNGGIAQVVSIDHTSNNLLGIFAKYCLIVHGKKGGAGAKESAAKTKSKHASDI
jgi:hypothetical protein